MKPLQQINEILSMHRDGRVNSDDAITLLSEAAKSKGQRAYELRKQGMNWKEIGEAIERCNPYHLADDYAYQNNQPWPLPKLYKHSKGFTPVGKDVYEMRRDNPFMTWLEIGKRFGVTRQAAQQSAAAYANKEGLPVLHSVSACRGFTYYTDRAAQQWTWNAIAKVHGKTQAGVYITAKRYATRNNLPWPI